MLHTIQVSSDEIPILPPAVDWVAVATLGVMFPNDSWNVVRELGFMLGGGWH